MHFNFKNIDGLTFENLQLNRISLKMIIGFTFKNIIDFVGNTYIGYNLKNKISSPKVKIEKLFIFIS